MFFFSKFLTLYKYGYCSVMKIFQDNIDFTGQPREVTNGLPLSIVE